MGGAGYLKPPHPLRNCQKYLRGLTIRLTYGSISGISGLGPVSAGLVRLVGGFLVGERPERVWGENCVSRAGDVRAVEVGKGLEDPWSGLVDLDVSG